MKQSRQIQVLRQIQAAHDLGQRPKPRAVGLNEKEFQEMADEELFELAYSVAEPQWFDYTIEKLSENALGLLSNAEPLPELRTARIVRVVGKRLWELLLVALGVVLGWYLKKHYGQ
jgi:hypothetical protein